MSKQVHPLWWLIPIALGIKLGYLFFAFPEASSTAALSIDALYHYNWASSIASGEILANAPYFRAPLYPIILAILLKMSGGSLIFVRIVQFMAGCLMLIYSYRLAEKVADKRAAITACLLLTLYPVMTYSEGELLLDAIFSLFALISLYYFLPDINGRQRPIYTGLFLALAAITRPTVLVFIPFAIIYLLLYRKRECSVGFRLKKTIGFLAVIAVIIAPVTIVNYVTSHQFILISYQGGVNFYIGNNSQADGLTASLPPVGENWTLEDAAYLAQKDTGKKLSHSEQSSYWYEKGIDYIRSYPKASALLLIKKIYYAFSGHEISNNRPLDEAIFQNPLLRLLPVRFSLIIPLAILPLLLGLRERKGLIILYSVILIYGMVISVYFVNSRFRLPLVPLLAILAGTGIVTIYDTIRARRFSYRLFMAILAASLVFATITADIYPEKFSNPQYGLFLRGNISLRGADYRTAAARFDSLSRMAPYFERSFLNLGIAYLKMGQVTSAADAFRQEFAHNPYSAEAANNLGVIFLLERNSDSARHYFTMALELKPYYREAAINYLRTVDGLASPLIMDSIESTRKHIKTFLSEDPAYLAQEGLYYSARGDYRSAIDDHLSVIKILKEHKPLISFEPRYSQKSILDRTHVEVLSCYQLGYLYGLTGAYDSSIIFSRQAIELAPDMKSAYINLISGYNSIGDKYRADSVISRYKSFWPDEFKQP